jgi:hypothetical protein
MRDVVRTVLMMGVLQCSLRLHCRGAVPDGPSGLVQVGNPSIDRGLSWMSYIEWTELADLAGSLTFAGYQVRLVDGDNYRDHGASQKATYPHI